MVNEGNLDSETQYIASLQTEHGMVNEGNLDSKTQYIASLQTEHGHTGGRFKCRDEKSFRLIIAAINI